MAGWDEDDVARLEEPPESQYGEANTRLALQSAFGPGPLRASERDRRREDRYLFVCGLFSLALMSGVAPVPGRGEACVRPGPSMITTAAIA